MTDETTPTPAKKFCLKCKMLAALGHLRDRMKGRERTTIEGIGLIIGSILWYLSGHFPELAPYADFVGVVAGGLCLILLPEASAREAQTVAMLAQAGVKILATRGTGVGALVAGVEGLADEFSSAAASGGQSEDVRAAESVVSSVLSGTVSSASGSAGSGADVSPRTPVNSGGQAS